jgi:alkylhydroperoxidase family enzyme
MARIPLPDENDPAVPEETRAFLTDIKQLHGRVLNVMRAMGNSPASAKAFFGLVGTAYQGNTNLDPKHAELAYFTATAVNRCFY